MKVFSSKRVFDSSSDNPKSELPVQQATKFEFVINVKAAKQIGHTIPVALLAQANQVIK